MRPALAVLDGVLIVSCAPAPLNVAVGLAAWPLRGMPAPDASANHGGTGTGAVVVLREGKRFDGTWSRQGTEMYRFADGAGKEVVPKPGLTWIQIVPMTFDLSS
jgi:DUF3048 family protein